MSAFELTAACVQNCEQGELDFVCLNFGMGDMVGHTGMMDAAQIVRRVGCLCTK
jgi:2,3-bisphosphoglycerate-independent phosphoglycerate mutase